MAADLSMPVIVVGCPTIRDDDGVALSSRNAYLSEADRSAAVVLSRALAHGASVIADGEDDPAVVMDEMAELVASESSVSLEYAAVVDGATMEVPQRVDESCRLIIAARVGQTRLIDNIGVER